METTVVRRGGWGVRAVAPCLLLLLLALAHSAAAQPSPVTLTAALDRNTVTVGDRIRLTVTLTVPADARADLTALEGQTGDLELLVVGNPDQKALADGQLQIRQTYDLAAFQVGDLTLPALSLPVHLASGETVTAASPAQSVTVQSVIPPGQQPADVRDLKPQISLDRRSAPGARTYAAVAAGALVALLALTVLGWSRRPRLRTLPLPPAPRTPEAVARAELDRIAAAGLLEQGEVKSYHALLAACIRRYLSERYDFPAQAMTTSELRRQMEGYGVGRWQARLVSGLLSESDAANYAQYVPARARSEANLEIAYQIVEAGEPVSATPTPELTPVG